MVGFNCDGLGSVSPEVNFPKVPPVSSTVKRSKVPFYIMETVEQKLKYWKKAKIHERVTRSKCLAYIISCNNLLKLIFFSTWDNQGALSVES